MVDFLDRNGYPAATSLERARIPEELVQTGGWVTKRQAYDLVYEIVKCTTCPQVVFEAYGDFQLTYLGPIANAVQACKTVKEALDTAIQLGSLAYEGSEFRLRIEGDTTWFCYSEPNVVSAGQPFIEDMTIMIYYHLIRETAGHEWRPQRLRQRGATRKRHSGLEIFNECQTELHAEYSALAFPTAFLSRRLVKPTCKPENSEDWQLGPLGSPPTVDAVYRLLASRFPYRGLPTLDGLATLLEVSPATLKRQLACAGTTYSQLLDRLRYDTACELLANPQMTLKEIALELGYSGSNNFVRSFRRMTGVTPGQFRLKQSASTT